MPPFSISQAGQACVCRSQAWDAKIVTSAWWVHASQVSNPSQPSHIAHLADCSGKCYDDTRCLKTVEDCVPLLVAVVKIH